MSLYLIQASYNPETVKMMLQNPEDRSQRVRQPVETLGGKVHEMFFSFGDYDALLIVEMPSNVAAAAIALAFASGGAVKNIKTTPLLSTTEAVEAFKQAGRSGYQPLTSARAAG